jgi:hypothetical protein
MNKEELTKQFNDIVEFNDFDFIDLEDEVDTEITETNFNLDEAMELNYLLSTVMQQISALQMDLHNDIDTGWLDTESVILLRELTELCEDVIDRTYNDDDDECDECDDDHDGYHGE